MNDTDQKVIKNVLVYDLGGGTLDVTIIQIINNRLTIKAITGNINLGG